MKTWPVVNVYRESPYWDLGRLFRMQALLKTNPIHGGSPLYHLVSLRPIIINQHSQSEHAAFHTAISVLYLQHFPLAHLHIVHSFKCQHVNELVHIIMYSVHLYEYIVQ